MRSLSRSSFYRRRHDSHPRKARVQDVHGGHERESRRVNLKAFNSSRSIAEDVIAALYYAIQVVDDLADLAQQLLRQPPRFKGLVEHEDLHTAHVSRAEQILEAYLTASLASERAVDAVLTSRTEALTPSSTSAKAVYKPPRGRSKA